MLWVSCGKSRRKVRSLVLMGAKWNAGTNPECFPFFQNTFQIKALDWLSFRPGITQKCCHMNHTSITEVISSADSTFYSRCYHCPCNSLMLWLLLQGFSCGHILLRWWVEFLWFAKSCQSKRSQYWGFFLSPSFPLVPLPSFPTGRCNYRGIKRHLLEHHTLLGKMAQSCHVFSYTCYILFFFFSLTGHWGNFRADQANECLLPFC